MSRQFDVVLVGEILVELYSGEVPEDGTVLRLGFSGDVLNAAAAAAAAGARTAVLTTIGDDELGTAMLARAAELGIDTSLIHRNEAANGAYMLHGDLYGQRQFTYWRTGSAASRMTAADIRAHEDVLHHAGAVVLSGIFAALSPGCAAATLAAARIAAAGGAAVVYDPNYRQRMTTAEEARAVLAQIAPYATVVTPSCPGDSLPLLGTMDPVAAAVAVQALGANATAITHGSEEVMVATSHGKFFLPVPANPDAVDATGAGDVFAGTLAARLALGDSLGEAAALGVGAASLSVSGRGGTGHIPLFSETRKFAPAL